MVMGNRPVDPCIWHPGESPIYVQAYTRSIYYTVVSLMRIKYTVEHARTQPSVKVVKLIINDIVRFVHTHITSETWIKHAQRTCLMYHAACKAEFQPFNRSYRWRSFFNKKLKNVSCEYDRLNGCNSTLQAAWYVRHVRWTCLFYSSFIIWFLWTKPTILSLILSFTQKLVRACSMFYPYEGYRSVTPLDAARVNRTISITILCTDTI